MANYNQKDIVQRIDLRLAELGISKSKFYAESGVSSATISQWNNGVCVPTAKKLQQVADYLQMSVYDLVGDGKIKLKDSKTEKAPQDELAGLRDDQKELVELIRGFNSRQCREVYNLIEAAMKLSDSK